MPRKPTPLPDGAPITQRAAHAFVAAAKEALGVNSAAEVAKAVGESVYGLSHVMRGREGSLDRVHRWCVAMLAHGVLMRLVVSPDEATIEWRWIGQGGGST